jgi:hypothetical protein
MSIITYQVIELHRDMDVELPHKQTEASMPHPGITHPNPRTGTLTAAAEGAFVLADTTASGVDPSQPRKNYDGESYDHECWDHADLHENGAAPMAARYVERN